MSDWDDEAQRFGDILGDSLENQIRNLEYLRDRQSSIFDKRTYELAVRARELRATPPSGRPAMVEPTDVADLIARLEAFGDELIALHTRDMVDLGHQLHAQVRMLEQYRRAIQVARVIDETGHARGVEYRGDPPTSIAFHVPTDPALDVDPECCQ